MQVNLYVFGARCSSNTVNKNRGLFCSPKVVQCDAGAIGTPIIQGNNFLSNIKQRIQSFSNAQDASFTYMLAILDIDMANVQ